MQRIKSNLKRQAVCAIACVTMLIGALSSSFAGATAKPLHIVAFGDSLTAGYNLPPGADFASRLEAALIKRGHNVKVSNAGVSGDTTAAGLARFEWAVPQDAKAVIVQLGANDALRGIAPEIARANLEKILSRLKKQDVSILLAGMQSPANWGNDYKIKFDGMFTELADRYGAILYPFFLEGIIHNPQLKLPDALHPNAAGVDEIVRRILPSVEQLIERASS